MKHNRNPELSRNFIEPCDHGSKQESVDSLHKIAMIPSEENRRCQDRDPHRKVLFEAVIDHAPEHNLLRQRRNHTEQEQSLPDGYHELLPRHIGKAF